ncbi:hypothetical protein RA267_27970, partial [Pseudomonas syringae pv. tagetis]|uniref:hypothetical protein n=1 Tax=Pseudomonas syringae group genomosp. 7 TaxID=251699 RepID=UPI0037700967
LLGGVRVGCWWWWWVWWLFWVFVLVFGWGCLLVGFFGVLVCWGGVVVCWFCCWWCVWGLLWVVCLLGVLVAGYGVGGGEVLGLPGDSGGQESPGRSGQNEGGDN